MADVHRWDLDVRGTRHRVEIAGSVSRTVHWYVDDALVATKKSSEDKLVLDDGDLAVGIRFTAMGRPKRVTLFEAEGDFGAKERAVTGVGGIDLDPEPGSPAALREQRIREHPVRHTLIATAGGVAKVVVPIVLGLLAVRFAVSLPWPSIDLPSIPLPDLPSIPWPSIPWPDIPWPDWEVPGWVRWLADKAKYVWPVLLALALASGEVRRRRKQDALKAELDAERRSGDQPKAARADERQEKDEEPS